MDQKFAVLSKGPNYTSEGYNTLYQAREDGALVLAYGYANNHLMHGSFLHTMQSIYRDGCKFLGCQPYPVCCWTFVHVFLPQQNHQTDSPVSILQAVY